MIKDLTYVYKELEILGSIVSDDMWISAQFGENSRQWPILNITARSVDYSLSSDMIQAIRFISARI